MKTIDSFSGKYEFLSNFYPSIVVLDNVEYPTVEHAYNAAKTFSKEEREMVKNALTPGQAKKIGQKVKLREDWEDIKISVMKDLVSQKFTDPVLKTMLQNTGDAILIEGNWWNDRFWGVCKGVGRNELGKILMEIRG